MATKKKAQEPDADFLAQTFRFRYKGSRTFELTPGNITGTVAAECERVTGYDPMRLLASLSESSLVSFAKVLWFLRWHCGGESRLKLSTVLDGVTYADVASFEEVTDEDDEGEAAPSS